MEYLVLARKWRPQIFDDVIGQDHVVQTLKNAIRMSRIAHAYIFSGPRGIGKTSIARIFSKALNCESGPTDTPCNQCVHCREITDGLSLDVREIDGASNRGIDEIRELRDNVKFAPVAARYKIFIIDEVHMLTKEAFNALLKTIEEPPSHVIFIFATTELHKVPATILSRCQSHDFRRVALKPLRAHLRKIAEAEDIRITDSGLEQIAEAGDGSMRDAESIFDQVIAYAGNDIQDGDVEQILGLSDRKMLGQLSAAILERNGAQCLKTIDEAYYAGIDMKFFYQRLVRHFMNLLMVKVAGSELETLELSENETVELKRQSLSESRETLQRLVDILIREEEEVRRSTDPRLHLEFVLLKMTYLEPLIPINEMVSRMEALEGRLSAAAAQGVRPASAPMGPPVSGGQRVAEREQATPPAPPETKESNQAPEKPAMATVSSAEAGDQRFWNGLTAYVKGKDHPLWSKIVQGAFQGYAQGELKLGFPKGSVVSEMIDKERLAAVAGEYCGMPVTIRISAIEAADSPNGQAANGAAKNLQQIRREALQNPLVQKVIDLFEGAEIREIIPKKQ